MWEPPEKIIRLVIVGLVTVGAIAGAVFVADARAILMPVALAGLAYLVGSGSRQAFPVWLLAVLFPAILWGQIGCAGMRLPEEPFRVRSVRAAAFDEGSVRGGHVEGYAEVRGFDVVTKLAVSASPGSLALAGAVAVGILDQWVIGSNISCDVKPGGTCEWCVWGRPGPVEGSTIPPWRQCQEIAISEAG